MVWVLRDLDTLISDPKEVLDVFDFEPVAKKNLPPARFGYMVTGIDDEVTLRANRDGFLKYQLRPRRLVDVSIVDMTTELFGVTYDNPIVIAPTGSNRAFHPDGELAVARAAKAGNHLQILPSVATTSIEDAIAAHDAPVWFQLYPTQRWEIGEALVQRAQQAGCPVIVVTLGVVSPLKWETFAAGNYLRVLPAAIGWRGSQTIVAHCLNPSTEPLPCGADLCANDGPMGGRT